jgi:uncharacterized membrane protein
MLPRMADTAAPVEGDEHARAEGEMDTGRVLALSDGVFAIAATLLVLDLRLPDGLTPDQLTDKLRDLLPAIGGYALSYVLIGIVWLAHHRLFRSVARVSERLARLNIVFLGLVSVLPFVTSTLARYGDQRLPTQLYAALTTAIFLLEVAMVWLAARQKALADHATAFGLGARATAGALVFASSIGIAALSPSAAKYFWFALIPTRLAANWAAARRHRT